MKQKEVYKCEVCGKVIEILHPGVPETICCGQAMNLMEEKTADWKGEKHVPKITIDGNKVTVDVGISMGTPHPMTEEHYIEWIEIIADGKVHREFLQLGDKPEAEFCVKATNVIARAYCNLHGLWRA